MQTLLESNDINWHSTLCVIRCILSVVYLIHSKHGDSWLLKDHRVISHKSICSLKIAYRLHSVFHLYMCYHISIIDSVEISKIWTCLKPNETQNGWSLYMHFLNQCINKSMTPIMKISNHLGGLKFLLLVK